jgi:hypothetical protein
MGDRLKKPLSAVGYGKGNGNHKVLRLRSGWQS